MGKADEGVDAQKEEKQEGRHYMLEKRWRKGGRTEEKGERRSRRRKGRRQLTSWDTHSVPGWGQYISYFLKESRLVLTYTVIEKHWKETTNQGKHKDGVHYLSIT